MKTGMHLIGQANPDELFAPEMFFMNEAYLETHPRRQAYSNIKTKKRIKILRRSVLPGRGCTRKPARAGRLPPWQASHGSTSQQTSALPLDRRGTVRPVLKRTGRIDAAGYSTFVPILGEKRAISPQKSPAIEIWRMNSRLRRACVASNAGRPTPAETGCEGC